MTFTPFSLSSSPEYQALDSAVQDVIQQLIQDNRLNEYGCFKRPPNTEITARSKVAWKRTTPEQRAELKYRPLSTEEKDIWSKMSSTKRKEFWLAAAVRIATRIAYPGDKWDGLLSLSVWAKENLPEPQTSKITEVEPCVITPAASSISSGQVTHSGLRIGRRVQRGTGSNLDLQKDKSNRLHRAHPYQDARTTKTPTQGVAVISDTEFKPPEWLRSALVYIGPQQGLRRRLVMSTFQTKDKVIWVEEEVDENFPSELLDKNGPRAPRDTRCIIILRDYSNPQVPDAIEESGDLYTPTFRDVSEFHQYLTTYKVSADTGSHFIWNGLTLRANVHEVGPLASTDPIGTAGPTVADGHSVLLGSVSPSGYEAYAPNTPLDEQQPPSNISGASIQQSDEQLALYDVLGSGQESWYNSDSSDPTNSNYSVSSGAQVVMTDPLWWGHGWVENDFGGLFGAMSRA
ncbi:HMG (high mobility group) box protein [Ceratobasidium sp. AG-Ba]|nr:HMG (high mobility group) box protein [Ceratobasidium sp. AG-Ba]